MKRTWCFLFAMLMLFTVGCSTDRESEEIVPNEDVVPNVEYTIYLSGDSLSADNTVENTGLSEAAGVQVERLSDDCSFSFSHNTVDTGTDLPSSKTLYVDGKQYDYAKMICMIDEKAFGKDSKLQEFGKIFIYYKSGEYHAEFLAESNQLVEFYDTRVRTDVSGEFTEEDACEKSEAIIKELYGEGCLEYYSDHPCETSVANGEISVSYIKYVGGYETNDKMYFLFNTKGELIALFAKQSGVFATVSAKYSSKQLKNAETMLFKHVDSVSKSRQDTRLVMNTQGKCYLEVRANCGTEDKISMRTFYINVE